MKLVDFEKRVLRAYRDEDLSGLIPGAALNAATEHLYKLGLIDWNGITQAGRDFLEPPDLKAAYDEALHRMADDGCPHA